MDILELGAVGELIGGAAVIVTLVYLAAELRRNRLNNEVASVDALMELVRFLDAERNL